MFQFVFNIVHNGKEKTPMHISVAQTIHDTCRSKQLVQIFNRMGYGISYSELEQIDNALTQRTIRRAGSHRVPVPLSIKPSVLIQGAMDNFDHEENTSSGIGGSHDTILVLFQNCENADQEEVGKSCKSQDDCSKPITHILDCQKLVRVGGSRDRGEISPDYKTGKTLAQKGISDSATNEHMTWGLSRFVTHKNLPKYSSCDCKYPIICCSERLIT